MVTVTIFITMWVFIDDVEHMTKLYKDGWGVYNGDMQSLNQNWINLTSTQICKVIKFKSHPLSNWELLDYINAFNHLTHTHVEWATTSINDKTIWDASYIPKEDRYTCVKPCEEE